MFIFRPFQIVFLILITFSFSFGQVSSDDASIVARNFMYERMNQYGDGIDIASVRVTDWWNVEQAFYVFNLEEGWIIVSERPERLPVIGYNFTGSFPEAADWSQNVKSLMQTYIDEAKYIVDNTIEQPSDVRNEWRYYLTSDPQTLSTEKSRDVATPLLTSTWNQNYPYNIYCPEGVGGPGGHVYVGCVATAMSMIMHYWRYPSQGQGQNSYYASGYGWQTVNYGSTSYDWNGMRDAIHQSNLHDIALIGYHAAVSVNMMFGVNGSGAYSEDVPSAMITHFLFSNQTQIVYKNNYSNTIWENILQIQLDAGQPMYYSGCGTAGCHAFVCDGYQGSNYYHFNLGWGGSANGWYNLQTTGGFPNGQAAVINLTPSDLAYPYIAQGQTLLNKYSGSFSDGSGPVQDYPSGMNASWLISPQGENDSISSIILSFRKFNTGETDFLRVYKGNTTNDFLLAEYAGNELPPELVIQNNCALVTFSSASTAPGFVAEYRTTLPNWCSGTTLINEPSGTLEDGSGLYHYNHNSTCAWVIKVPDAKKYKLTFTKFSTEEDSDFLFIRNGNNQPVATLTGQNLPSPIEIESDMVLLVWFTNSEISGEGWEFFYETLYTSVNEEAVFNHFSLYPNPADDKLSISFGLEQKQHVQISLTDIAGKEILSFIESNLEGNQNITLNLQGMPKGVYFLRLNSNYGMITRKVLIR